MTETSFINIGELQRQYKHVEETLTGGKSKPRGRAANKSSNSSQYLSEDEDIDMAGGWDNTSDNNSSNEGGQADSVDTSGSNDVHGHEEGEESSGTSSKRRRDQVKIACTHCKKACKKCDESRPCGRCARLNLECIDAPRKVRKKRSPNKRLVLRATLLAAFAGHEMNSPSKQRRTTPEPSEGHRQLELVAPSVVAAKVESNPLIDPNPIQQSKKQNRKPNQETIEQQTSFYSLPPGIAPYAPGPSLEEDQNSQQSYQSAVSQSRSPSPPNAQILIPPEMMLSYGSRKPKRPRIRKPATKKETNFSFPAHSAPPPPPSLTIPFANSAVRPPLVQPKGQPQYTSTAPIDYQSQNLTTNPTTTTSSADRSQATQPIKKEGDSYAAGGHFARGLDFEAALALAELSRAHLV